MMDLYLATPGFAPLQDARHQFILASNGLFRARENHAFRAVVRCGTFDSETPRMRLGVDERLWTVGLAPSGLPLIALEEELTLKLKLAERDFQRGLEFFRRVLVEHGTEALLYPTLDPRTGSTGLHCPDQWNRPAGVEVDSATTLPEGVLAWGTWHSHPENCQAFRSDVDRADEDGFDGLHIICGDLTKQTPSIVAALVVWGKRRELRLEDFVAPDAEVRGWMKRLRFGQRPFRREKVS